MSDIREYRPAASIVRPAPQEPGHHLPCSISCRCRSGDCPYCLTELQQKAVELSFPTNSTVRRRRAGYVYIALNPQSGRVPFGQLTTSRCKEIKRDLVYMASQLNLAPQIAVQRFCTIEDASRKCHLQWSVFTYARISYELTSYQRSNMNLLNIRGCLCRDVSQRIDGRPPYFWVDPFRHIIHDRFRQRRPLHRAHELELTKVEGELGLLGRLVVYGFDEKLVHDQLSQFAPSTKPAGR